ncbi:MAG: allophanate hydrolase [Pseudomonadota bacterium]
MIPENFVPHIGAVTDLFRDGTCTVRELVSQLMDRADQYADHNIWIRRLTLPELEPYLQRLEASSPDEMPLYGVPFAIKDNIDLERVETTAACPEFTYLPEKSAFIVQRLIDAGAIPLGKSNMDQFATGLVGTRSPAPWGPCKNAFDPAFISGGSSAGSAVAVALGLVSFSLGTDTAGSGRVPAMLNNIYGLKPSRGLLSMSGIVPACRTLDCPSIFALCAADAQRVFSLAADSDDSDPYSRANPFSNTARFFGETAQSPVIGIPPQDQLEFFGEHSADTLFKEAVQAWRELGAETVEVDFAPLLRAATLLYDGPWVAERYAALEPILQSQPQAVHEVVRGIVESARDKNAVDAFKAEYELQEYRAAADKMFERIDFLLSPTAPRSYLIDELLLNPVELNSNMGYYTNYMNLLDLCGLALPAGFMSNGIPFGVTLVAPRCRETALLNHAVDWEQQQGLPMGASDSVYKTESTSAAVPVGRQIQVAVCGAHLKGMPLNWQLAERGAELVSETETSENYRFYALKGGPVKRPGLVRDERTGCRIKVEVWSLPAEEFGSFVAAIPYPLGIGKLELDSGEWVSGFICEGLGIEGAEDISNLGSWRTYISSLST